MENTKTALKLAIEKLAEEVGEHASTYDSEQVLQLSQAAANLTNVLTAIVNLEDMELHTDELRQKVVLLEAQVQRLSGSDGMVQ